MFERRRSKGETTKQVGRGYYYSFHSVHVSGSSAASDEVLVAGDASTNKSARSPGPYSLMEGVNVDKSTRVSQPQHY